MGKQHSHTDISPEHLLGWLAANLKFHRAALDLAQERLALEAGVDRTMVSKIERGLARNPGIETILRLANRLQVQPHELLRPRDPMPEGPLVRPGRKAGSGKGLGR